MLPPPILLPPGTVASARRLYGPLGVRLFKRIAPNGDLVNRLARRRYPGYRVLGGRADLPGFLEGTRSGERGHLVFLLMGLFTAVYAARIGWHRWALFLTLGNTAFNLYPVMLQRYNRARIRIIPERDGRRTMSRYLVFDPIQGGGPWADGLASEGQSIRSKRAFRRRPRSGWTEAT